MAHCTYVLATPDWEQTSGSPAQGDVAMQFLLHKLRPALECVVGHCGGTNLCAD